MGQSTPQNSPNGSRPDDLPRVVDRRPTPSGVMPRHLQQWVLIGTALVMVGIMALSGPTMKPRATPVSPASTTAIDANQQRIEEYQRRIQEESTRLTTERAKLELAKQGLTTNPSNGADVPSPQAASGQPREPRPGADMTRASRTDRALFADNVAYSRPSNLPALSDPAALPAPPAVPALPAPPAQLRKFQLPEGTIIETVLTNRLDGTFTGPVNCLVSVPVYAPDYQHLLIPAGSRGLGEARAVNTFGQTRLAVTFHRLVLPNGTRLDLHQFHGLNQIGDLGLHDQVNRHYAQIFGASLAVGGIAGLAQAGTRGGIDARVLDESRQGASASLAQSSARILDRFLNILPSVTIREGHRIKVYLSDDSELPEYPSLPTHLPQPPYQPQESRP